MQCAHNWHMLLFPYSQFNADMLTAVSLEPTTMESALDERRLKVKLNADGIVMSVGSSGMCACAWREGGV